MQRYLQITGMLIIAVALLAFTLAVAGCSDRSSEQGAVQDESPDGAAVQNDGPDASRSDEAGDLVREHQEEPDKQEEAEQQAERGTQDLMQEAERKRKEAQKRAIDVSAWPCLAEGKATLESGPVPAVFEVKEDVPVAYKRTPIDADYWSPLTVVLDPWSDTFAVEEMLYYCSEVYDVVFAEFPSDSGVPVSDMPLYYTDAAAEAVIDSNVGTDSLR